MAAGYALEAAESGVFFDPNFFLSRFGQEPCPDFIRKRAACFFEIKTLTRQILPGKSLVTAVFGGSIILISLSDKRLSWSDPNGGTGFALFIAKSEHQEAP